MRITGFYNKCPRFEFLYRNNLALNIANEKTTTDMVDWAAGKLQEKTGISFTGYSFYGDTDGALARYVLLAEPENEISKDMTAHMPIMCLIKPLSFWKTKRIYPPRTQKRRLPKS